MQVSEVSEQVDLTAESFKQIVQPTSVYFQDWSPCR